MCDGLSEFFKPKNDADPAAKSEAAQRVILASSGLKALGELATGMQGRRLYKYQQAQSTADANAEAQLGEVRGNKIRKAGRYAQDEARAGYGASGVSVNSGSALAVDEFIGRGAEEDALTEMYGGKRRAAAKTAEAQGFGLQADNAAWGGVSAAGKSLLSGAAASAEAGEKVNKWIKKYRKEDLSYP